MARIPAHLWMNCPAQACIQRDEILLPLFFSKGNSWGFDERVNARLSRACCAERKQSNQSRTRLPSEGAILLRRSIVTGSIRIAQSRWAMGRATCETAKGAFF